MCGVFAISDAEDAARLTFLGLFALQHRGQESAGVTVLTSEKELITHKERGLVADVFSDTSLKGLKGRTAVGHVRYSTMGGGVNANIQPLTARIAGRPVALAHNGNVVNSDQLRERLEGAGSILQGTADTEIVLHLMARNDDPSFVNRFMGALGELEGAFTGLLLLEDKILGYVDPRGYRPLVLGKVGKGWVLASETCALDLVGANFVRDILPGELVVIDLETQTLTSRQVEEELPGHYKKAPSRCVFEHIYFSRPDSFLWGKSSTVRREELGVALARTEPIEADVVIAIPDSGIPIAMGFAQESGIPYRVGLIRNHYVGRTFIEPSQEARDFRVRLKLNPVREIIQGKRIVVVDDSIVRGTTSRYIIKHLREAGAVEVHMRIGSPAVRFPCFYGIDTPKRKELLAQTFDLEGMRDYLGADSLRFLSEDSLVQVMNHGQSETWDHQRNWCISCFSGTYQDSFAQEQSQGNPPLPLPLAQFELEKE